MNIALELKKLDVEIEQNITKCSNYSYTGDKFTINTNCEAVLSSLDKLKPFIYSVDDTSDKTLLTLYTYQATISDDLVEFVKNNGRKVKVDTSLYVNLCSDGLRYDADSFYIVYIEKTKSLFVFKKNVNVIYLINNEISSLCLDTARIIKSLISIQEELNNKLMLHASGVIIEKNKGLLLCGDSRNGKTSILLELISKFKTDVLSCDTSIVSKKDNGITARGWPSNFSVSTGTMFDYECLAPLIPDDRKNLTYRQAWEIYDKYVVDTFDVVRNAKTKIIPEVNVDIIIFLKFNPAGPIGINKITDFDIIHQWIKKVYLGSRDELYPNWHEYWITPDNTIDENIKSMVNHILNNKIEIYEMNWAPGPEQLLRNIDLLDKSHYKKISKDKILSIVE